MITIEELKKKYIKAIESGQDPAPIQRELAELRAKIAMAAEREELQKIADARQSLRDKAEVVKAKVKKQSDAIDRFLELRDTLVKQLQPLIEPMKGLAKLQAPIWEREPGDCYIFNDIGQFAGEVRGIPEGYLPADFGCPFLEMAGGQVDARDKAGEAYSYLVSATGILSGFQKGISTLPLRPIEGLMAIDDEPYPDPEPPCKVCQHPDREAIDKAISEKTSLRDIASQYGISKSTVDRHKAHLEV